MSLIGVDVGTTQCKAAIFADDGALLRAAVQATPVRLMADGSTAYRPEELWQVVASVLREVAQDDRVRDVSALGVAGMAESGLLVDRVSGTPRGDVIPWFDPRSQRQAAEIEAEESAYERFRRSGLHSSFKYGLAKILWARAQDEAVTRGAMWLSVPDYIVYRLTGRMTTDPSLAVRSYAYSLAEGEWDQAWMRHFGLDQDMFPEVMPSGRPIGSLTDDAAQATGLTRPTRAAVAGHDHVCALLGAGIVAPGRVLDSIGTAESLMGVMSSLELNERSFATGLALVPHVVPVTFAWMGGIRSAGGSIKWIQAQLSDPPLSDEASKDLLRARTVEPTGILYFPYVAGSGGVRPDDTVRASFVGLSAQHTRADLLQAVLEGTAYEAESIRRAAEGLTCSCIDAMQVTGGGARNHVWLQIKADVTGCRLTAPAIAEGVTLGAALTVGLQSGHFAGLDEVLDVTARLSQGAEVLPDPARHAAYTRIYETGYRPCDDALRRVNQGMVTTRSTEERGV